MRGLHIGLVVYEYVLQLRVVCHYFSQTQCKFCPRIVLSKKKALISEGLFLRRTA